MSLETCALTVTERNSEGYHVGNACLCRVAERAPPSVERIRQFNSRSRSPACHVNEPVRRHSSNVPIETAPMDIVGANGAQKAQNGLSEAIVSFVPLGAVLAGNELQERQVYRQQLLKCSIVARQETLPQRFNMLR